MLPADRRKRILTELAERRSVRVAELSHALGVSEMTIHRDLQRLASQGQVRKVRGGAVLPAAPPEGKTCCVCYRSHRSRVPVVLQLADNSHRHACCAHCGLIALFTLQPPVNSALVTDFLYGRMVNCRTASYVLGSQMNLCCTPTILAFERPEDAQRFQQGFGGQVLALEHALRFLRREMALSPR